MSALISEESLAQLMLSQNDRNDRVALTAESYLGERMPSWTGTESRPSDMLDDKLEETLKGRRDAVDEMRRMAEGYDKSIPKGHRQDMLNLMRRILSSSDVKFRLEQHAENLEKLLVQNRVEASVAAMNVDAIASEVLRLENQGGEDVEPDITTPSIARNNNALLNAAMELYTPDEAETMARAAMSYLETQIEARYPGIAYAVGTTDDFGRNLDHAISGFRKSSDGQDLVAVASMISSFANEHLNESRRSADGFRLTAFSSKVIGGSDNLHSSFQNSRGTFFSLRIQAAHVEDFFGTERIRSGAEIVNIGLSAEDMMMALRGHPTGADIPCSIDHVIGNYMDRPHVPSEIEQAIQDGDSDTRVVESRKQLKSIMDQANAIIQDGAKRVADRRRLVELVNEIAETMEEFSEFEQRDARNRADDMASIVTGINRAALESIDEYVRERHGVSLASIGRGEFPELEG